jgi:hypothetical protein
MEEMYIILLIIIIVAIALFLISNNKDEISGKTVNETQGQKTDAAIFQQKHSNQTFRLM